MRASWVWKRHKKPVSRMTCREDALAKLRHECNQCVLCGRDRPSSNSGLQVPACLACEHRVISVDVASRIFGRFPEEDPVHGEERHLGVCLHAQDMAPSG